MASIEPGPSTPAAPRTRLAKRGVGPFSLRQVTMAIGIVALAAIALTLASRPLGNTGTLLPVPEPSAYLLRSPLPGLSRGDLAPELSTTRADGSTFQLTDLDGKPVRLADLRGKVVWLNFWSSWCPPCQYETPILRALDQRYRDRGLALVGVQVQQTVDAGRTYASTYKLQYPIGADVSGEIFRLYKAFALPTQFFIDQRGVIQAVVNGPLDEKAASAFLDALLPPAPSPSPGPSSHGSLAPSAS
jgi:cytochrome c biogenesis protein CcmG/thiol:disulfide interchange protein DsbE